MNAAVCVDESSCASGLVISGCWHEVAPPRQGQAAEWVAADRWMASSRPPRGSSFDKATQTVVVDFNDAPSTSRQPTRYWMSKIGTQQRSDCAVLADDVGVASPHILTDDGHSSATRPSGLPEMAGVVHVRDEARGPPHADDGEVPLPTPVDELFDQLYHHLAVLSECTMAGPTGREATSNHSLARAVGGSTAGSKKAALISPLPKRNNNTFSILSNVFHFFPHRGVGMPSSPWYDGMVATTSSLSMLERSDTNVLVRGIDLARNYVGAHVLLVLAAMLHFCPNCEFVRFTELSYHQLYDDADEVTRQEKAAAAHALFRLDTTHQKATWETNVIAGDAMVETMFRRAQSKTFATLLSAVSLHARVAWLDLKGTYLELPDVQQLVLAAEHNARLTEVWLSVAEPTRRRSDDDDDDASTYLRGKLSGSTTTLPDHQRRHRLDGTEIFDGGLVIFAVARGRTASYCQASVATLRKLDAALVRNISVMQRCSAVWNSTAPGSSAISSAARLEAV